MKAEHQEIVIKVGEREFSAILYANATAQSFLDQLPLMVEMEDYAKTEKIFYPPAKLSVAGASAGMIPRAGDITYYVPWGDVAVFYQEFSYASGLIEIGKIEDFEGFAKAVGPKHTVTIEIRK